MNVYEPPQQGQPPELAPPPAPKQPPPPQAARPARSGALARLLESYRRRQTRLFWGEALLWGAGAWLSLWLAAGFLGHSSSFLAGILVALGPLVAAGLAGFLGAWRSRKQVGGAAASARRVGEACPGLGGDALSAVELERELESDPGFSRDLAAAFLDEVDRRASKVQPESLIDGRRARQASFALAGAALVATVLLVGYGQRWTSGFRSAVGAGGQGAQVVLHEPITGDVELTYRYPAYTGLTARTVVGTMGEVSAPAGTQVQLRSRSDRPVRRAEIVINGEALPLQVEEERILSGSFVVEQPGAYHFRFLNALGRPSARGPDVPIAVEADAAPKVELTLPGAEVEVDPDERLTLRFEVTDDFGLSSLELVYRTSDGKEHRRPLPKDDGRRTRGTFKWDLGPLQARPGDRITYHVEAKDNDAVAGPKAGVSRTQVVRIYSAAEHRRDAVRRAEALWERLILQLGDRLEGGDLQEPPALAKLQGGQAADENGVQLGSDLLVEGQQLASSKDAPEELAQALISIGDSYGKKARLTHESRRIFLRYGSRQDPAGNFGRRFAGAVRGEVEELEKDILYLESLIDRRKLEDLREMARELDRHRQELTSRIEDYQRTQDPEAREAAVKEVAELRQRIAELQAKMMELARGIRDEHLNAEAMAEMMEQQDMGAMLDEIEQLMREGKTDEALKKLQELSMELDEMMKRLDDADERFGEEQNPELTKRFREFSEELEATAQDQKEVAEQTKELRDRYREKLKERLQRRGEAMREQLLEKVEQAAREYQALDPNRLNSGAERNLSQLQNELENVRNALQLSDFDLAAEAAARAERGAEDLSAFGQEQVNLDEMWGNPPEARAESRKLGEKLSKNERTVREVNQALQQLFPPAGSMMSQEDQQRLQQLGESQQKLEQRAQGLGQQMDQLQQMAPLFDQGAQQQMEQIGQRMGEASRRMAARDPARGHGEQQAALEQLQRFQQQMQQNRGQGRGRGLPMPMMSGRRQQGGQGSRNQDVELPDPDQHQAPREFRKDVLDAMKEGVPEKYQDQVKRYYEELVR